MLHSFKLVLIAVVCLGGWSFAGTEITLPVSIEVVSGYIRLGEVAQLSGEKDRALEKVFLGKAPVAGKELVITRDWIEQRIKAIGLYEGVSFSGSNAITVIGVTKDEVAVKGKKKGQDATAKEKSVAGCPVKVAKKSAGVGIVRDTPEKIADIVSRETASTAKTSEQLVEEKDQKSKLQISRAIKIYVAQTLGVKDPEVVAIPRAYNFTVDNFFAIKVEGITRGELGGRSQFSLALLNPQGKIIGFGEADVNIAVSVDSPVIVRSLRKGEEVRKGDIQVRKVRYKAGIALNILNPEAFVGKVATKMFRAGDSVCAGDFDAALDVVKGKPVTVIAKGPCFQIKEITLALADGRKGDFIKVQAVADSSRVYNARVTGPGTADMANSH